MGKYKILIADDEAVIRDGMIQKIDWHSLGFEIVASAENGVEALELLEQTTPDVIMTDVKMPFMNGLELIEKAIEILPAVKIVVFSGFDDFEYAQKAIKLNVEEYILKPISAKQLTESLKILKKKMDVELSLKRDVDSLRKQYVENYPILREQFLGGLLEGTIAKELILGKAQQFQVNAQPKLRTVVAVAVDYNPIIEVERFRNTFKGKEELIPISIKQIFNRILDRFHMFYSFQYGDLIVAIVEMEWESQISLLINEVNELCREAHKIIGLEISAGIGNLYQELSDIRYSYKEAKNALEYSTIFCREGEHTAYIRDVEPSSLQVPRFQLDDICERNLINAIKSGDPHKIKIQIQAFFKELEKSRLPFHLYQIHILELFTLLFKMIGLYQIDSKELLGEELNSIHAVLGLHSLNQIQKWFEVNCIKISEQIQLVRGDSGKSIAGKALRFLEEHFREPEISVEKVCEELHVSPAYFSTVFKKEMNATFVSYLTDLRLGEAVKLLETTNDKTYMIAAKVGYMEPNYFSYVFKKKYGMSPSKYRLQEM